MINFGIDLGTTNSAIAKFEKGQVVVFKNPVGQKDTLPSVVAFRKDKIIVGEKAREFLLKASGEVAGSFKRKMGTTESWYFSSIGESKTPVELSAFVLRELKNFVHTGEPVEAAVITIPASFDTIQSNATKNAGYMAGFEQVVLLQEPIAASLAYANQDDPDKFAEGQWLVYDLGGGTFDVALVKIHDGEMKIVDHEGDNFLGGNDFDKDIVEKILIPRMEEQGIFANLSREMKSASGKYNRLYHSLLLKAEDAKVQLSALKSTDIEFEIEDDKGQPLTGFVTLTRRQFENLLEPYIRRTVEMTENIMRRNFLTESDIRFVLMVGGSTYIPYVREKVAEKMRIPVNTQVDPTTAVAVGAAFYAGTRRRLSEKNKTTSPLPPSRVQVVMAYQKATQEMSEYFTAKFSGNLAGLSYRIIRLDGGYDSGQKSLKVQIQEDLPLVKDNFNQFEIRVLDEQNNLVETDATIIGITQGRYSVVGQPLPADICLEIDDMENNTTALEVVFEKNALLPVKRTLVKQVTRTLTKGSQEQITINVVEGPGTVLPAANLPIGFISIPGKTLNRDLVRGSDIEITLEMTESRDLKISAYLMMTDQEYKDVFTPSARKVNLFRLREELNGLRQKLSEEIHEVEEQGNYEAAQRLVDLEYEVLDLSDKAEKLSEDDTTDEKFQIEDQKRKIARQVDEITRDKRIIRVKNEYFETKRYMEFVLENYSPSEQDKTTYAEILSSEKNTLATNSPLKIQEIIEKIRRLNWQIRWKSSRYVREFYRDLIYGRYGGFTHSEKAYEIIQRGQDAINENNDDKLRVCINQLCELLPPATRKSVNFGGTGIG
ncbi:MAG: Hsp70 family protein [Bacteroidia bacterium]|nr:Hsp70 family protein [Bacteroidia bacterium]